MPSIVTEVTIIPESEYPLRVPSEKPEVVILTKDGYPIGLVDENGNLALPLLIVNSMYIENITQVLLISQNWLFRYPHSPGIVVVDDAFKTVGAIKRESIASELDALFERNEPAEIMQVNSSLSGIPKNVPFVIYCCPMGDYEYIPFQGSPDHLCPTHHLKLTLKEASNK